MKASAERLQLAVDWVGAVYDRAALNDCYREASIFVYPSVAALGEAFPLAPLESMAQGCPVVTSDLKCFSDSIAPGVNGDAFALGGPNVPEALRQVIAALMQDEPRRRAYADAGLETVRHFSLTKVADVFVDDFERLCAA